MGKDERLYEIYLKIHQKKVLMMDDLRYLAKFDPECFVRTWEKIVNSFPQTKTILEPPAAAQEPEPEVRPGMTERQSIEKILENLKRLEGKEIFAAGVDTDSVKNLLGNLYMELLFTHREMDVPDSAPEAGPGFDKKA